MNPRVRLLLLLLLLLPQIACWIVLSHAVPFTGFTYSYTWYEHQPITLRESGLWYADGAVWKEAIRYDLQAMRWEQVPAKKVTQAQELAQPVSKAQYWRINWDTVEDGQPCQVELIDNASQKVLKTRVLPRACRLVDHRYAIYDDNSSRNSSKWLDLDDPSSEFQTFAGWSLNVRWLSSPNEFIVVEHESPGSIVGLPQSMASILQFREGQAPRVVATWKSLSMGRFGYVMDIGNEVVSISPDGKQFEFRSKQDGSMVHTESIPGGVDFNRMDWDECLNMETSTGWLNYDVVDRKWIEGPDGGVLETRLAGTGLQLFRVDGKHQIYNATNKKILFEAPIEDSVHFLDDGTIVHVDDQSWLRFHIRSADDGRILRTYAPFSCVNPGLVILLVLYAIWSMQWMRASLRAGIWAWIDNLIINGLPMAWCCYRCLSVGPTWDIGRLPYQYLAGGILAIVSLGLMWAVFGKTRWMLRLLPLMIFEAVILLVCRLAFGANPDPIWRGLMTVNLPALGILVVLLCLRSMHWRLQNVAHTNARPESHSGPTRLSDLFLVTVGVALVAAASGSSISFFNQSGVGIGWPDVIASVMGIALVMGMMLAGMVNRKRWFLLAACVCCILLVVLCAETLDRFPVTSRLEYQSQHAGSARVVLSSAVACFVAALPYRLRGYRLVCVLPNKNHMTKNEEGARSLPLP